MVGLRIKKVKPGRSLRPPAKLSNDDATERLRMILNSARDGIISLDVSGCIDGVNPAIEQMFGYSQKELIGADIGLLYEETPTDQQVRLFLARVRTKAGTASYSTFQGKRKDCSTLLCEVAVTPMPLPQGVHYVAIVRDITERSRIAEMKDQFVATVSHELRTPLTSISGSLGLLAGGAAGELPKNALKLVQIAHSNSERLVRLINDILDIEKIESGKMVFNTQPVMLSDLIERSLEGMTGFAEQYAVKLNFAPTSEEAIVAADPDRLLQVMSNLLSNAIKFSPNGATVGVDLQPTSDGYRVSVTNSGQGIPDEFRDRIFARFAQADGSSSRQQGGTGLGLNIVKEIIARLGGRVGFDSRPGEGATFYFELPAIIKNQDQVLICTNVAEPVDRPSELSRLNMGIRFTQTISEMRQLLKAHWFSAIILDLRLTEAFRAEAVQAIQAEAQNSPLIILAGDPETVKQNLPLRALLEWLEKPLPELFDDVPGPLSTPAPGGRILHVEDDDDILVLVANAFGPLTEVISARNLDEGLNALRKHRLDAVILDLELGSECGLELLPRIRLLHPAVPIVVFSASDAEASAASGVDRVFTKSRVNLEEVVQTVHTLITAGRK